MTLFCEKSGSNPQNPQLLTVINLTAIAIRRLIKMSKKISAFKNMCQEDQVALLKGSVFTIVYQLILMFFFKIGGCVEMMILRSVMQYDGDRGTWKVCFGVFNAKRFELLHHPFFRFPTVKKRCPTSKQTFSN